MSGRRFRLESIENIASQDKEIFSLKSIYRGPNKILGRRKNFLELINGSPHPPYIIYPRVSKIKKTQMSHYRSQFEI